MSKNANHRRASFGDYLAYGIYRVFESFLRLLPMEIVCLIGSAMGQITYFLMSDRRQVAIRNLRIVYGHSRSPQEIRALARKTFRLSGLNLISSISASTLSTEELLDRVEVEGRDHLINAKAQGNGCILLLAHMGNWELLTQLHILVPEIEALASLYRPLNNPLLDRLIKRRRQRSGTQLFSKRDGFAKPISHLKMKGTLGVIADQNAGKQGVLVPLFGKLSSMTYLPALLCRKTNAPIIPVSMCTLSPGKWRVIIHPAIPISNEEKKHTAHITTLCASAYETLISESPADVLWMHQYWRVGKKSPLKIHGLLKKKLSTKPDSPAHQSSPDNLVTKPFRLLLFTGDTPATDLEILAQIERLRGYRTDLQLTTMGVHPFSQDFTTYIPLITSEPPHIAANNLRNHELNADEPFDCALDFTTDSRDSTILNMAGISLILSLHGKHRTSKTQQLIKERGRAGLQELLEGLGLPPNTPTSN